MGERKWNKELPRPSSSLWSAPAEVVQTHSYFGVAPAQARSGQVRSKAESKRPRIARIALNTRGPGPMSQGEPKPKRL